jgi:hypothetical protein
VRFRVNARAWLTLESSPRIHDDSVWESLSFTRKLPKGSAGWTGKVRTSLTQLADADGAFLDKKLSSHVTSLTG